MKKNLGFVYIGFDIMTDILNLIFTGIGILSTSVLTIVIIKQTSKINEDNIKHEAEIRKRNEYLCEREHRINVFPMKKQVCSIIIKILGACKSSNDYLSKKILENASSEKYSDFYEIVFKNRIGNIDEVMGELYFSQYIFPDKIADSILDIRKMFDKVCGSFIAMSTLDSLLQGVDFAEKNIIIAETKDQNMDVINKNCKAIVDEGEILLELLYEDMRLDL